MRRWKKRKKKKEEDQHELTVILFWVRVPVLSEQIVVVDPRVSTDSRFLTKTLFLAILLEARVRSN